MEDLFLIRSLLLLSIHRCDISYILLEMHRIVRPGGTVIIRDHRDIILKVKRITDHMMKWKGQVLQSENGPSDPERVLLFDIEE